MHCYVIFLVLLFAFGQCSAKLVISASDTNRLAEKIWQNECRGTIEGLTSWNQGEEFPSLGIGHFIWYPEGYTGKFQESFPQMITFLQDHGVKVAAWICQAKGSPWKSREDFLAQINSQQTKELRQFLYQTRAYQAMYIADRLEKSLPKISKGLTQKESRLVAGNFSNLARSANGLYALIDYLNFKGEGSSVSEQYGGKGWGLKQVLLAMDSENSNPVDAFIAAAKKVLKERVDHSPSERNEQRWLKGWFNRLETYGG
jgi:hypothetical protein